QGFACVKTPVQNIRSRDRKRASPMTAFGSEAAERLNRRERPVCPERRHLAVEVAGNPVAFSDARQTGVLRHLSTSDRFYICLFYVLTPLRGGEGRGMGFF
ncbi:hypothetical protein, partial [Sphingomonas aerolata]|uniref:hypothetical protein n=1 Tax=Sphingomonas aerolata TaxID=185951 RepID=UPI003359539A